MDLLHKDAQMETSKVDAKVDLLQKDVAHMKEVLQNNMKHMEERLQNDMKQNQKDIQGVKKDMGRVKGDVAVIRKLLESGKSLEPSKALPV